MHLQQLSEDERARSNVSPSSIEKPVPLESHITYQLGLIYGRLVYRLRWPIIAFWIIALLVSVPFANKIGTVLTGGGYQLDGSESIRANNILVDKLHFAPSSVIVAFQSAHTPVQERAYQNEMQTFIKRAQNFAHVKNVTPGQIGRDGRTTFVTVDFNIDTDHMQQQIPAFRKLLPTKGPAKAYLTGNLAVYDEFTQIAQKDTEQADSTALPIALVLLLFAFGSLLAAATPLLLAIVAVPVALSVIYIIAQHQITSSSVLSIATVIGLGLSIDYSLLMTRRFRDELRYRDTVKEAVAWTLATAGEAILFSGFTVIIGFGGLLLIGLQSMTTFGLGGAVVVCAAMFTALTLLPALFGVLGNKINALRIPFLNRRQKAQNEHTQNTYIPPTPSTRLNVRFTYRTSPLQQQQQHTKLHRVRLVRIDNTQSLPKPTSSTPPETQGFWHNWAMVVMKRPALIAIATSIIILILGWPILSIKIGVPSSTSLPADSEAHKGLTILQKQIPGAQDNPIYIVVQTPDGSDILTPKNLTRLDHLTHWVGTHKHITSTTSLTSVPGFANANIQQLTILYSSGAYKQNPALVQFVSKFSSRNTTMIVANSNTKLDSDEGIALIDQLRSGGNKEDQGLHVMISGLQAITLDVNRFLYGNFPKAILFVLIATYLLLLLMFRSILLPLKAVLMNILSISVAYGIMVAVFQWGNLENVLNFQSEGFIESTIPVVLFCVLFGLSMDYEVFLLSRMHEEWQRTYNNRRAVALGLEKTAGVITNAALILVIVAGAITFTSLISTKEIGLGIGAAVLADATIIRLLLVPATMRLLGRWNWWLPGRPLPTEQHD